MTQWIRSSVNFLPIFALLLLGVFDASAQGAGTGAELSPYRAQQISSGTEVAPFDLQFSFDASAASGAGGNAGAEFDGTYYYTTRWASNLFHKYDMTGALVEAFSVPGVTSIRDLAFDGTYMYGSNATTTIYQMDFVSKTLIGTITSPVAVRHIAYDPDADGFWVGTWDTDISLIDRSGVTIDAITGHGLLGMYGSAHDSWTAGGPYLWVFDQGAGADTPQLVHQFNIATGTATGTTYDVGGDFVSTGDIAGGLFAAEGIVPGTASIGGLLQGTPNWFFVYELAPLAPVDPVIAVDPLTVSETLAPGDSVDVTVTVSNNGGADLDWSAAITSSASGTRVQVLPRTTRTLNPSPDRTPTNSLFPTVSGFSNIGGSFISPLETEILYDQTAAAVTGAGYTSQDFEASQDAFDNQGADDFVVPSGETWNVNQITALGVYYNGFGPMPGTNVFFYEDAGGAPGTLVDSRLMVTPTSDVGGTVVVDFADIVLTEGTYWISVQARMDFAAGGQWGWTPNNASNNSACHWQNPGNGFATGCITWSPAGGCIGQVEPDYAFIICGTTGGGGGGSTEWISLVGTTSGTVTPGNSATFDIRLRGIDAATEDTSYAGTVEITSNDPASPSVVIDVTLDVTSGSSQDFSDNFDTYTSGQQLVLQNNVDWDTWTSMPGSGEDPFVSSAFSNSGANSVLIVTPNDLVRRHGELTSGAWGISWNMYIPNGSAGYFNHLSGFSPNPNFWAMECYFDVGGTGRLLTGEPQVDFNWTSDAWVEVKVIVDLDVDQAQFLLDGDVIAQWPWTSGTSGMGGPLVLDATDLFGATASDQMYVDDFNFSADSLVGGTSVGTPTAGIPDQYGLGQNYPNPFNPTTRISFALPEAATVTLRVYDILGQEVITLENSVREAGVHEVTWNGRNSLGASVGSGVYFYRLEATGNSGETFASLKKMLFVK